MFTRLRHVATAARLARRRFAYRLVQAALIGAVTVLAIHTPPTGCPAGPWIAVVAVVSAWIGTDAYRWRHWQRWHQDTLATAVYDARRDAGRDKLTGLDTRAVLDDILDAATRDGTPITIALADLDGLHSVNNGSGHAAGDRYIIEAAARLRRAVPEGGVLVRQGGDEFTILAPASVPPHNLADAIGAALAGPAVIAGRRLQPRASVGVASSTAEGTGWHTLACADAAMYTAKAAGGQQILTYDPDRDGIPALDGTRPPIRQRELDPARRAGVAWLPTAAEDVVGVLVTPAELRLLHEALVQTRDRWQQHLTDLQMPASTPTAPAETGPDRIDITPTPAGLRAIADRFQAERRRYADLADRVATILAAVPDPDGDDADGQRVPVVLGGISGTFTADEIETLVITAADAVCAGVETLSARQMNLARRAYQRMGDTFAD